MTVTAVAGVLAAVAGRPVGAVALVTVAVFCGQLSVGWSNDAIDAERDAHTDRRDKPTVANGLSPRALFTAALVAVAVSAVLSLAVGPAGWWHIAALVSAWAYNWPLKRTIASALPFAISFGALVAFAAPDSGPGLIAAGAALGVAAHFANVIPDLADDAATGVV
ncbi:UbiA family prenyltransferase, partial [Stackebrandtia soli]|uniref:UbiA family prenyltransferase n=1 Tax=Stackebrandtia soli TaxID=1892856 RepID=UPI0039EA0159